MKKLALKVSILAIGLASGQAMAHVGYGTSLYDQAANTYAPTGTAGLNPTVTSNGGYIEGLQTAFTANSHDNKFRFFTLTTTSQVDFTITGTANLNGAAVLNPGFSLFHGLVPAASHDGVGDTALVGGVFNQAGYDALTPAVKTYLANEAGYASWSPFAALNVVIDHAKGLTEGTTAASAAATNWGVYDANGNFSMGNNPGLTNTLTYTGISGADAATGSGILGADGTVDNKTSWSGILNAGTYSLVIGGANQAAYDKLFADAVASNSGLGTNAALNAAYLADRLAGNSSIAFHVSAVPVPGAVWLFLSGMMGVLGLNRRKKSALSVAM